MPNASNSRYEIERTLGFLVTRSHRLMGQQLEGLFATVGVNVRQHAGMQLLYEGLATCPGDIARTLGIDTGFTTRLVNQLADKGFVVRNRGAGDRRQVTLALTAEGRAAAEATQRIAANHMQSLLGGFDDAEAETFLSHLTRLVGRLEDWADA